MRLSKQVLVLVVLGALAQSDFFYGYAVRWRPPWWPLGYLWPTFDVIQSIPPLDTALRWWIHLMNGIVYVGMATLVILIAAQLVGAAEHRRRRMLFMLRVAVIVCFLGMMLTILPDDGHLTATFLPYAWLGLTLLVFRLEPRKYASGCLRCGYDAMGDKRPLPPGVRCPECGTCD